MTVECPSSDVERPSSDLRVAAAGLKPDVLGGCWGGHSMDTRRSLDGHSTALDAHSTALDAHSTALDAHSTLTRRALGTLHLVGLVV